MPTKFFKVVFCSYEKEKISFTREDILNDLRAKYYLYSCVNIIANLQILNN